MEKSEKSVGVYTPKIPFRKKSPFTKIATGHLKKAFAECVPVVFLSFPILDKQTRSIWTQKVTKITNLAVISKLNVTPRSFEIHDCIEI